jgi:hypothetical protein
VAFIDQWCYYELVIHPPPLNIFTFILLPFMIKGTIMKSAAAVYSKFIFWFENCGFIIAFFLCEMCLLPLIYFRVLFNVFALSSWAMMIPLTFFWLIIGPFYLIVAIFKDVFYFVKIMCDYQEEEDTLKEKEEEDFKQDKIVIYNEIIDVMRSVMHLFKKKKEELKKN